MLKNKQTANEIADIFELLAKDFRKNPDHINEFISGTFFSGVLDAIFPRIVADIKSGTVSTTDLKKLIANLIPFIDGQKVLKTIKSEMIKKMTKKPKKAKKTIVVLDVFEVFIKEGKKMLRQKLASLETENLRQIVSQHGFDPAGKMRKWKNKERLTNLIIDRVEKQSKKGDVFMKGSLEKRFHQAMLNIYSIVSGGVP